jgi:hypothetical protein
MANEFRIKQYATSGTPAQPSGEARPTIEYPPIVQYPLPLGISGLGRPVNICGLPYADVGRPWINTAGLTEWNALYPSTTAGSSAVKVALLDPRTMTWKVYSGLLFRYMLGKSARPGSHQYTNLLAHIGELEELGGWD